MESEVIVPAGDKPLLPLKRAIEELTRIYHAASDASACVNAGADAFVDWYNSAVNGISLVYGSDSLELDYLGSINFGGYEDVTEENCRIYNKGVKQITDGIATWIRKLADLNERRLIRHATLVRDNMRGPYNKQDMKQVTLVKIGSGLKVRTAFEEYTLGRQIGEGGNGRVFAALSSDGPNVAIKLLDKEKHSTAIKRFKNEIKFCEHHKHPNIVKILDHGYIEAEDIGYSFYVMPLYGKTLRERINEGISPDDALEIFKGILRGLKEAHSHNVIHRDIKPENIMFAADSSIPVICDFGIAHIPNEYMATVVMTQPKERMANWGYAAPEQKKKGGEACFQSDIYAAALILNEMFTGEVPSALEYTKIGDVVPEYAYLDDIFAAIYRQDPQSRLYPEDKILLTCSLRQKQMVK